MIQVIKIFKETIPVKPVPASRPKVTRYGTYYTKTYMDFRKEMYLYLSKIKKRFPPEDGEFKVEIKFICKKPKKPTNNYPQGDVDNFLKGPLDAFTKQGMFWKDDVQVVELNGTKRYQEPDEEYGMEVTIWKKET